MVGIGKTTEGVRLDEVGVATKNETGIIGTGHGSATESGIVRASPKAGTDERSAGKLNTEKRKDARNSNASEKDSEREEKNNSARRKSERSNNENANNERGR